VWWLARSPHSERVPGSIPTWGLSVWSLHVFFAFFACLHVLPVYAWVLSGYSGLLPPSKSMHVRLIGDSKLSLGESVSVCGCLSRLSLCGPVMDLRPVQGVPRLSPDDRWDRLKWFSRLQPAGVCLLVEAVPRSAGPGPESPPQSPA